MMLDNPATTSLKDVDGAIRTTNKYIRVTTLTITGIHHVLGDIEVQHQALTEKLSTAEFLRHHLLNSWSTIEDSFRNLQPPTEANVGDATFAKHMQSLIRSKEEKTRGIRNQEQEIQFLKETLQALDQHQLHLRNTLKNCNKQITNEGL